MFSSFLFPKNERKIKIGFTTLSVTSSQSHQDGMNLKKHKQKIGLMGISVICCCIAFGRQHTRSWHILKVVGQLKSAVIFGVGQQCSVQIVEELML